MQRITTYETVIKRPEGHERRRTHTFTHVAGKDTTVREYHLALPDGSIYVYDMRDQQEGETDAEYAKHKKAHAALYPDAVKAFHKAVKGQRAGLE